MKGSQILIWCLSIYSFPSFGQCGSAGNKLFDSTLNLIFMQAPAKGDATGRENAITENVYKIVYETPDSVISIERKLDILHLMVYFGKQNADPFKNRIRNKFMANDSIIERKIIFLLPITFSSYGGEKLAKRITALNKDSLKNATTQLNGYYAKYYSSLIDLIFTYKTSTKKFSNDYWTGGIDWRIEHLLLSNKGFIKKYPCFNRFLKK
jgi:hypothetical protein